MQSEQLFSKLKETFYRSEYEALRRSITLLIQDFPTMPADRLIQAIRDVVNEYRQNSRPLTFHEMTADIGNRLRLIEKQIKQERRPYVRRAIQGLETPSYSSGA